jgi:hypothetical protein
MRCAASAGRKTDARTFRGSSGGTVVQSGNGDAVVVNLENGKIIGRFSGLRGKWAKCLRSAPGHRAWRSSELPQPIAAAATRCNVIEFC